MRTSTAATALAPERHSARIQALRQRCFERKLQPKPDPVIAAAQALQDSADVPSWQVCKGLVVRERLRRVRFDLDEHELLIGRLAPARPDEAAATAQAAAPVQRAYAARIPASRSVRPATIPQYQVERYDSHERWARSRWRGR